MRGKEKERERERERERESEREMEGEREMYSLAFFKVVLSLAYQNGIQVFLVSLVTAVT